MWLYVTSFKGFRGFKEHAISAKMAKWPSKPNGWPQVKVMKTRCVEYCSGIILMLHFNFLYWFNQPYELINEIWWICKMWLWPWPEVNIIEIKKLQFDLSFYMIPLLWLRCFFQGIQRLQRACHRCQMAKWPSKPNGWPQVKVMKTRCVEYFSGIILMLHSTFYIDLVSRMKQLMKIDESANWGHGLDLRSISLK